VLGSIVAVGAAFSTLGIGFVFGNLTTSAREVTRGLVFVIAFYMPIWTVLNAQFAISRAGGDTALGMYVDVSVNLVLFVPGAFILALCTPLGPVPMLAIIKVTDIVKWAIARWYLKKERWVKNLTVRVDEAA
jgi:Na+-driven multidrug efflux pump